MVTTDIRGVIASDAKVESTVQSYIIAKVGVRPANEFRSDELKKLLRWVREHAGPTVSNEVLRYIRRIYNQARAIGCRASTSTRPWACA